MSLLIKFKKIWHWSYRMAAYQSNMPLSFSYCAYMSSTFRMGHSYTKWIEWKTFPLQITAQLCSKCITFFRSAFLASTLMHKCLGAHRSKWQFLIKTKKKTECTTVMLCCKQKSFWYHYIQIVCCSLINLSIVEYLWKCFSCQQAKKKQFVLFILATNCHFIRVHRYFKEIDAFKNKTSHIWKIEETLTFSQITNCENQCKT